jgi:DNA-binding CsgD family transcriptional regulator
LARQIGDAWIVWGALHALALAALALGDLTTARALPGESQSLPAAPNMLLGMQIIRGLVALEDGEHTAAREHLMEALALAVSSADPLATAQVVEYVAHLASCVAQSDVALRLAAAAEAARDTLDVAASRLIECLPHLPLLRELRERWLLPLRSTVDVENARKWWAEGRALSLDEAVELAKIEPKGNPSPALPRAVSYAGAPLTPRQLEVAVLVGQGLTNRQIAERLVVTERGAAAHVERILDKLGVGTRAQIAAWAAEQGLLTTRAD